MTSLLFVGRAFHLAELILVVGAFGLLLIAGPPASDVMRLWERWVQRGIMVALAAALLSGVLLLAAQAAAFEGRPQAALDPGAILRAMVDTRAGFLWTVRMGLLAVLAAFLTLCGRPRTNADIYAARVEGFGLSAIALVVTGAASHAAVGSSSIWPGGADMAHLISAGVWGGGLPPLALLLFLASSAGPRLDPAAVQTMQRFSRLALVCVLVLAGSGLAGAWLLIGGFEGLFGTTHGHLLLAKLALLVPALLLAALSRAALPRLSSCHAAEARTTARHMALFIAAESGLVLTVIGLAVAMSVTAPALHDEVVWPFPFRLSYGSWPDLLRLAEPRIAGALAMAVLAIAVVARLARGRPALLAGSMLATLAAFAVVGLRPLLVHATPASFARPTVPYSVGSLAEGRRIYEAECSSCHGEPKGAGAEGGSALTLASKAVTQLPGDLFWEVTKGTSNMPTFATRLSDGERWSVIHYLRAFGLAALSRSEPLQIGPEIAPDGAWLASVDFPIAVGPLEPNSLSDFRGRKMVLLVLYNLPVSRVRMSELAKRYGALSVLGVEVVAVPPRSSADAIADLGQSPPSLFPVVTDGVEEIVAAYRMFAPGATHAEFLIDRAGYIRAIWRSGGWDMPDANEVQAQVERLNAEKAPPSLPDEHIH